jgi:hypothetical protein
MAYAPVTVHMSFVTDGRRDSPRRAIEEAGRGQREAAALMRGGLPVPQEATAGLCEDKLGPARIEASPGCGIRPSVENLGRSQFRPSRRGPELRRCSGPTSCARTAHCRPATLAARCGGIWVWRERSRTADPSQGARRGLLAGDAPVPALRARPVPVRLQSIVGLVGALVRSTVIILPTCPQIPSAGVRHLLPKPSAAGGWRTENPRLPDMERRSATT